MFEKNDRALLTARIIIMVTIGIFAVGSFVMGIVLAVVFYAVYFLFAFLGWFICWLAWVYARLYLSYLCDIKLIRNKLYGESNEDLVVFLKTIKDQEEEEKLEVLNEAKLALEELKERDIITEEEYRAQHKELLAKEKNGDSEINKETNASILLSLKKQLDSGAITPEEYEWKKNVLTKGK